MLREINDRAAIDTLLREGPLTRSDLEYVIGLSKPATAQLLTRLEQDGIVVKDGVRGGGRGPRAQLWSVNGAVAHVAAVDLTPHAAEFAIADITGKVLTEYSAPLPVEAGADVAGAFREATIAAAASANLALEDLKHVVIGAQGALNPATGHLESAPHLPGWSGFDLPGKLSEALGVGVTIENDVNLVALEEMISGEAAELRDFVLVWLSEGVGGAVVVGRRLLRGATGGGGEIDWLRIPGSDGSEGADGSTDGTGSGGSTGGTGSGTGGGSGGSSGTGSGTGSGGGRFGDLVDSPAIVALAAEHGLAGTTGWTVVGQAVRSGPDGLPFLRVLARRVALGVANVVSVVDPETVLLCGEVSRAGGEVLTGLVAEELHRLVIPRTRVGLASVPGNAVRAGALHSALAKVREQLFGLAPAAAVPIS
ncbi:ROK family transcriptional regulator [Amycolatopsis sp. 195334CR]|uniref:ROK family transcriptional regulator n=1 Tax=Amycolatopsis sp. 195334CR TaxID=2814588 RepID=UPI001A908C45|nr:ROK family transcriptional regulator [Amycolatopsis sp. 195334CR]MBN6039270.1 ROK family transcriptional regulator [Amycolatopsis sp. 195334CR]